MTVPGATAAATAIETIRLSRTRRWGFASEVAKIAPAEVPD